jgi:hypothetical protein
MDTSQGRIGSGRLSAQNKPLLSAFRERAAGCQPRIYALFFQSNGTLAPALEPNRAAAALAQPSKILPVVAPIPPAQFNSGNTIKWNKVL